MVHSIYASLAMFIFFAYSIGTQFPAVALGSMQAFPYDRNRHSFSFLCCASSKRCPMVRERLPVRSL